MFINRGWIFEERRFRFCTAFVEARAEANNASAALMLGATFDPLFLPGPPSRRHRARYCAGPPVVSEGRGTRF